MTPVGEDSCMKSSIQTTYIKILPYGTDFYQASIEA